MVSHLSIAFHICILIIPTLILTWMTIAVEIEMPGCTLMTGNAAEAMEVLLGAEVRRAPPLIFVCLLVLLL